MIKVKKYLLSHLMIQKSTKTTYPEKYDLRDYKRVTKVKNQGNEGYCWSFGSAASIESNILTNPNLSKKIGDNPSEKLDLAQTATPYYIMTNTTNENSLLGYSNTLKYYSDYHLKEYNQLSNNTDTLKDNIINNGAIGVYYYNLSRCYSKDTFSYCDSKEKIEKGYEQPHVVAIVGWNDNYSRDKFDGSVKPKKNGAWLCKNSWGSDYQDNGYFWISYECSGTQFYQFIMQDNSAYDNEYQLGYYYGTAVNVNKSANIFTAKSDEEIT